MLPTIRRLPLEPSPVPPSATAAVFSDCDDILKLPIDSDAMLNRFKGQTHATTAPVVVQATPQQHLDVSTFIADTSLLQMLDHATPDDLRAAAESVTPTRRQPLSSASRPGSHATAADVLESSPPAHVSRPAAPRALFGASADAGSGSSSGVCNTLWRLLFKLEATTPLANVPSTPAVHAAEMGAAATGAGAGAGAGACLKAGAGASASPSRRRPRRSAAVSARNRIVASTVDDSDDDDDESDNGAVSEVSVSVADDSDDESYVDSDDCSSPLQAVKRQSGGSRRPPQAAGAGAGAGAGASAGGGTRRKNTEPVQCFCGEERKDCGRKFARDVAARFEKYVGNRLDAMGRDTCFTKHELDAMVIANGGTSPSVRLKRNRTEWKRVPGKKVGGWNLQQLRAALQRQDAPSGHRHCVQAVRLVIELAENGFTKWPLRSNPEMAAKAKAAMAAKKAKTAKTEDTA